MNDRRPRNTRIRAHRRRGVDSFSLPSASIRRPARPASRRIPSPVPGGSRPRRSQFPARQPRRARAISQSSRDITSVLYIGTHANGVNSWLVEFNPRIGRMKVVVDAHKAIGIDRKGFGSQAKIHTRNNVGKSGKIYFGTKQGYPAQGEKREDYPGGYPMVYDPDTGRTRVYPIPIPHEGIISITPDEEMGVAYVSTCSDHRPGPQENAHFLVLDLAKGTYRDLIDTHHIFAFIVVDYLHRAYHPMLGGDVLRYDPRSDRLERLKQTIDGIAAQAGLPPG